MFGNIKGMIRDARYIQGRPLFLWNAFKSYLKNMIIPGMKSPCLMFFHTTYKCNAVCKYCSAAIMMKSNKPPLTKEEKIKAIKDAKKLGIFRIHITGGEPLLDPDVYDVIKAANPKEIMVSLVTNGLLLKKHAQRLKDSGLNILGVSLDSPDPETHDKIRGVKGLFKAAIEGVEEAKKVGLPIHLSTIATHIMLNNGDIEKLIDLARKYDADLNITYIRKAGAVADKNVEEEMNKLYLTDDDWKKLFSLEKQRKIRFDMTGNWRKTYCCAAGLERISLNAHGDLIPCDFIQISFGNIREEPLEKIWKRMVNNYTFNKVKDMCRMYDNEFIKDFLNEVYNENDMPVSWKKFKNLKFINEKYL